MLILYYHTCIYMLILNLWSWKMNRWTSIVCLKIAFCKICVTICGRFRLNEGGGANYINWMKTKYTANRSVQVARIIFKHTIKTDKAYFAASEQVLNTRSEAAKYALSVFGKSVYWQLREIRWRDLEKKVNSIFLPIQNTVLSKSEF